MNRCILKFEIEPGVTVKVYPDEQCDWAWAQDGSKESKTLMKKVNRGDVEQVVINISVFDKSGLVEGCDSIGGVVIGLDDHKQEIRDAIADNDMISEARADLKKKLKEIKKVNRGAK